MASSVTITFTNDWVTGDELIFSTSETQQSLLFNWVVTRSAAREITTGTPTANAGETAAINFKAGFDLDYPTEYNTVVQNTNEVLITSNTSGEVFYFVVEGFTNTGTLTVAYNNDAPASVDEVEYMLTKSPYYVNLPFDFETTTQVDVDLYIWEGDLSTPPATPTRTIEKIRPTVDYAEFNLDLANVSNDELETTIDFTLTTGVKDSNVESLKWVYYVASYVDSTNVIADRFGTLIALDGYGFYLDGVNPSVPSNLVLTDVANRKVSRSGYVLFPFINNTVITSITYSTENNQINGSAVITSSNENETFVQYLLIDVSAATTDEYLTVSVGSDDYIYEIVDECRYEPQTIFFKNKYGAYECVSMFKKKTESIQAESDTFVNNYISGGTYSTTVHEIKRKNITAKKSFVLNSGYIEESENDLYEQLILSDQIFLLVDSNYVPINCKTESLEFKTRVNDGLVNYTIEFEYGYNYINRV